jgi:MoxR-like ATPase
MIGKTISEETIAQIRDESERFAGLSHEVGKVIVGQKNSIDFITMALLCNGHILLEGVPGVAKTTMIKAVTQALGLKFNRIQFTPDLLPADLIGTLIYNPKTQEFEIKKGPVFANLVLADEINRAPAKVQSALLEAMQEHQITIGSETFHLDEPFLVFATQNPIEQEGTYTLPEAQLDRFMFKLIIDYPKKDEERQILKREFSNEPLVRILNKEEIFRAQALVKEIYMDEKVADYILDIVFATRSPQNYQLQAIAQYIQYGVSPRATLALSHTAKAHAFIKRRHFVTPDDVKAVAHAVLRHRLGLTYEAQAENITADQIIDSILNKIPSP